MELKGYYHREDDILAMWTGQKKAEGAAAECGEHMAVFVGTEDGHDIVAFEVIGGGAPTC